MKSDKGKQVFLNKIDDVLADKIIEHSETNSKDVSMSNQEVTKKPGCCDDASFGTIQKVISWSLFVIIALFLISLFYRHKKGSNQKP